MNFSKEKYYEKAEPFFRDGLLTEIFSTDLISVCNFADRCYVAFNYIDDDKGPVGLLLNPEHVRELADNDLWFMNYFKFWSKNALDSRSVRLNQQLYDALLKNKARSDIEGPAKIIDYEMEEEIRNKKGRGRR